MASERSDTNIDAETVDSFGLEWTRFDQSELQQAEGLDVFEDYFCIFPWSDLPENAEGFDMGCGSGRWSRFVAPRVGFLNCIDPSVAALDVAKKGLKDFDNVGFLHGSASNSKLPKESQDFGYSLGVLHHVPNTGLALKDCVSLLKPGATFLVYLYYRFDNRPWWFRAIWRCSDVLRSLISRLPENAKDRVTDCVALTIYWPMARFSLFIERAGFNVDNFPLSYYRKRSFYVMRTDARDRFGTPLEQRFSREEIRNMMVSAGLEEIRFSSRAPFWVAVGKKVSDRVVR